jgi:hypothetical protein
MRQVLFALAAATCLFPTGGAAQAQATITTSDSTDAVARATAEARRAPVALQFLGGAVAVPATLIAGAALASGSNPKPEMAAGPVALFLLGASQKTVHLPADVLVDLQSRDSAYARIYTKTYTKVLDKRRRNAVGMGALIGTMAGFTLVALVMAGSSGT